MLFIENKKKLHEINIITSILTLFVILIHTGSEVLLNYNTKSIVSSIVFSFQIVISFAVPGFIFLSGLKFFLGKERSFDLGEYFKFIKGRIKKILIPYFIFCGIYYSMYIYLGYEAFNLKRFVYGVFLKGDICYHLYFIVIIFQFYLFIPIFNIIVRKYSFKLILPISILITIAFKSYVVTNPKFLEIPILKNILFYNDRNLLTYLPYWIIGSYIGLNYQKSMETLTKAKKIAIISYLVTTITYIGILYINITLEIIYYNMLYIMFCSTSILTLYIISINIEKLSGNINNLALIYSKISYYVYLSHPLVLKVIISLMNRFNIEKIYIRWAISSVFTIVFSCLLGYIIENSLEKRHMKIKKQ